MSRTGDYEGFGPLNVRDDFELQPGELPRSVDIRAPKEL
jgi:hypothetical protein